MKILIAYLSYSGNTEEVAELIEARLRENGISVDMYEIGFGIVPNVKEYDFLCLGSFTWDYGGTPDEVKDFILEVGYKPENVAVFGTGDTQCGGDELYYLAVDKLVHFYQSKWPGLKIEQSPRGYQYAYLNEWVERVLEDVTDYARNRKSFRTA